MRVVNVNTCRPEILNCVVVGLDRAGRKKTSQLIGSEAR
jgi:hypothetical protein